MTVSQEEALCDDAVVEVLHELLIAVEEPRRNLGLGAKHALCRLAPAPVRHVRIDVCPEANSAGWLRSQNVRGRVALN